MEKTSSVKKNLFLSVAYQILNIILPLITAPYTARVLGAEGVGLNAYYTSIASYFLLFVVLGLSNYGNRTIAQSRDNYKELCGNFWNIYFMQFLCGIVVLAVYLIFTFTRKESVEQLYLLINGITVLSGMFDINWFFFGCERFKLTVGRNTVIKIISIVLIFTFVRTRDDLVAYMCIYAGTTLLSQIALWPYLFNMVCWVRPRLSAAIYHLKPNLILFIPVVAISIYKIMDKIMLGYLSQPAQTGFYEYAEKVINIPLAVIGAVGTVMMPRISNLLSKNRTEQSMKYFRDTMQMMMVVSFAFAFGLIGISENAVFVLFGKEFAECAPIICLLGVTMPFIAWANVIRTQYLIPLKKDTSYMISVIAGAVVNAIINLALIPHYGAKGAAIGTICAEVTVMVLQTAAVVKNLPIKLCIVDAFFPLLSAGIMAVAVRLVARNTSMGIVGLFAEILVGAVVFCVSFFAIYGTVQKERFRYLLSLVFSSSNK